MTERSIVCWYPNSERHLCGYCKNKTGNISHGMWAKCLTVEDYQNLIDRGWRRSGDYCYKPVMDQVCCPMYTIKCDVLNFNISKSQKKVIKKFNKFLNDGVLHKSELSQDNHDFYILPDHPFREAPNIMKDVALGLDVESRGLNSASDSNIDAGISSQKTETENVEVHVFDNHQDSGPSSQPKSGVGADPNKPPCKKARLLRLERKQEKLLKRGLSLEALNSKNEQKTLEEFLNQKNSNSKHKFRLELLNTNSKSEEWEQIKKIEFALYRKYQMAIHNDPPEKCTMRGFQRFLVNSPLQITLERLHEHHKYFELTADLFAKYQIAIHNEAPADCDESQFINFLLETPLQHIQFSKDSELGFGSFHQLYWLDDKLIAVGVIDILPKCVSAVYFFYDPDYRDLTLGTYGSLREVEFARHLHQKVSSIQNYYMGFYIHSCPKMRYKGKLSPSFLLCPETYQWVSIEKCIEKLEVTKYARFANADGVIDENSCSERDTDEIKLLLSRRLTTFKQYKRKFGGQSLFNLIGQLIGQKCARSLIFIADNI